MTIQELRERLDELQIEVDYNSDKDISRFIFNKLSYTLMLDVFGSLIESPENAAELSDYLLDELYSIKQHAGI